MPADPMKRVRARRSGRRVDFTMRLDDPDFDKLVGRILSDPTKAESEALPGDEEDFDAG